MIWLIGLWIAAWSSLSSLSSWSAPVPFKPGERLTYTLYLGVKAGELQMNLHENPGAGTGPKTFLAEAVLKTTGLSGWAFPVDDRVESVFTAQDVTPRRFSLRIEEKGYKKREKTDFTKVKLGPRTFDYLSLLYVLRAAPLAVGSVEKVRVWSDKRTLDLPLRVVGKEMVKSGIGKRECFILTPVNQLVIKDQPVEIKMAITADADRIPVSLSAHASVVTITVLLKTAVLGR